MRWERLDPSIYYQMSIKNKYMEWPHLHIGVCVCVCMYKNCKMFITTFRLFRSSPYILNILFLFICLLILLYFPQFIILMLYRNNIKFIYLFYTKAIQRLFLFC